MAEEDTVVPIVVLVRVELFAVVPIVALPRVAAEATISIKMLYLLLLHSCKIATTITVCRCLSINPHHHSSTVCFLSLVTHTTRQQTRQQPPPCRNSLPKLHDKQRWTSRISTGLLVNKRPTSSCCAHRKPRNGYVFDCCCIYWCCWLLICINVTCKKI